MKRIYKFQKFTFDIGNNILTSVHITLALKNFHDQCIKDYKGKFSILFKIRTMEGRFRCISKLQTLDNISSIDLSNIFNIYWSYKSDYYHSMKISQIILKYKYLEDGLVNENIIRYPSDYFKSKVLLPQNYSNLPNNTQIESWGDEVIILDDNLYRINRKNHSFLIKKNDNENDVTLTYNNVELLKFRDILGANNSNFTRIIGNEYYYFNNGLCDFFKQPLNTSYIKPKKADISIKDNFITMDLETRTLNKEVSVIASSIYDGVETKSFYITNFENSTELLKESILYLLKRKYRNYRVYLHNFSNYDSIFLLKIMSNINNCKIDRIIKNNDKLIDIKLSYNLDKKVKYSIYFRDSLLMLPCKLKKLCENFPVKVKKGIYPYKFVNNNINLNYIGKVPDFEYFQDITNEEYLDYCKKYKIWSLKDETIKYCEKDVISLYLILKNFQVMIFRLFEADINNYPTLSSLAFSIYRIKYLKNYKIPVIIGELYRNIKESYTGGSVDIYNPVGENINRYDVNSLYPSVMEKYPSPIGNITRFKGDILKHIQNPFGFFYVKIKTPENLHIPILQTRIKTENGGIRTISPLGEWEGWYFSEELYNAKNFGYEFEIIWGYLFDKDYIFKDYVNDLYKLKKESDVDSSTYIISKLLLNSLYGRFGMTPYKSNHIIIKGSYDISKFITNKEYIINDIDDLDDENDDVEVKLISYTKDIEYESEDLTYDNINVSIASSITSYARIDMSLIKMKYLNNIYYSDTDSIDLNILLPDSYISENLGDFKLEQNFKNIIYIAPKVYAAITKDNKEFIKIKGYKDKIDYDKVCKVLNQNETLELNHVKLYKKISSGKFITKEETYKLTATENKRKLIYENNKLVGSKPFRYIDGKLE